MTATVDRPVSYQFESWKEYLGGVYTILCERLLGDLRRTNAGRTPLALDTEVRVHIFAGHVGLRLADLDVESVVLFPHRVFASRAWVREQYAKFLAWCHENDWLTIADGYHPGGGDEPEETEPDPEPDRIVTQPPAGGPAPERRRRGRPRKPPVTAGSQAAPATVVPPPDGTETFDDGTFGWDEPAEVAEPVAG